MWVVYCHTNLKNGKKYVGITCQKPERRWRNGAGYPTGAFHNAVDKYGWTSFSHEILFSDLTEDQAKQIEKDLILSLHTNDKQYGYNITDGGDGTCGYERSPEEKRAMSESRKGRHAGSKNPMFGKRGAEAPHYGIPMSDSAKEKLSDALKARHTEGRYSANLKAVIGIKDGTSITFKSIAEASELTGVSSAHISRVCRGVKKTAGGYAWQFANT